MSLSPRSLRRSAALAALLLSNAARLAAAPVAVNDAYSTPEDTPLSPNAGQPVNAYYEGGTTDLGGFAFVGNAFANNANATGAPNVQGSRTAAGGFNGTAGMLVDIGHRPNRPPGGGFQARASSGGFSRQFNLGAVANVELKFRYRIRMVNVQSISFGGNVFERYGEAVCTVDGTRRGTAAGTSVNRLVAPTTAGQTMDSNWQQATFTINNLAAGNHTLVLGALSSETDNANQFVETIYDEVVLTILGGGSVTSNDTGIVGPVTAENITLPQHGALNFLPSGSFTYTPAANYFGPDSFTYVAVDNNGESNIGTVNITVTPVNDAPVAAANSYDATEDLPLNVTAPGLLANDTDAENEAITAVVATQPGNGTATVNVNGSFTYTPNANFFGTDTFTYRAVDAATAQSAPGIVTITVAGLPDPPAPATDIYKVIRNVPLVVSATTAAGNTTNTSLVLAAPETTGANPQPGDEWRYLDNGTNQGTAWQAIAFDDAAWKTGRGEFGYGDSADNRPEFTVIEDNPTAGYNASDTNRYWTSYFRKSFNVTDKTRFSSLRLSLLRDDGAVVYLNGERIHADGALEDAANDGDLDFQTAADNTSNESTHETINIATGAGLLIDGTNTVAVEVHQNTQNSSDLSFDLGVLVTETPYLSVLANDIEPDGQPMTAALVTPPQHGTFSFNPNGTFSYTPATGYTGADTFTYTVSDGTTASAPVTVSFSVSIGPNQRPNVTGESYSTNEDVPLNVPAVTGVLANDTDPDGDAMTAVIVSTTPKGSLTLNDDGSFGYVPASNANGTDTFTYRVRDAFNNLSVNVTTTITVNPLNDPPVAVTDSYATDPGQSLTVSAATGVLANDTDTDSPALTATLVSSPGTGTFQFNADGSFSFTPPAGFGGQVTFSYKANDGAADSTPVLVVIAVNGKPNVSADSYTATEDTVLTVSAADGVLKNDSDPELQPLTAAVVTQAAHGTVSVAGNGSFSYAPASNYFGPDSFSYTASDGVRTSAPVTASINVQPVNDPPAAAADIYSVLIDTPLTVTPALGVLRNDTDPDNANLTASLLTSPAQGTLDFASNGSFTYTPAPGFSGALTFTYRARDGDLFSASATVTLNVAAVSDTVAITEIMYNPTNGTQTQEYIELLNFGPFTIDLGGWAITAGVNFTIPAGTLIPANGYLVIPADPAAFHALYPAVTNYLSTGWGAAATLSNSGETVRLQRPDSAADDGLHEVDQVDYSGEGEWAQRQAETAGPNTGWRWNQPADGGGQSLQLRSLLLSNNHGQNWTSAAPTPGAANTAVTAANLAPFILDLKHSPAVPRSTDQVHVTCQIENEAMTGVTAQVWWRLSAANPLSFANVAMSDDGLHQDGNAGDGIYGAALNAQGAGAIIEFYVEASDGTLSRTWPPPALNGAGTQLLAQAASPNCLYQVDDTSWTNPQPMYRVIMSRPEGDAFVANSYDRDEASDTDKNVSVVFIQGSDTDIRYQGGLRYRGAGSRGQYRPYNVKMSLPADRDWQGWTAFNLNSLSAHVNVLCSRLIQESGLPGEIGTPVAVRLNGNNRLDASFNPSAVAVYSLYTHQTPFGREWSDRMFPVNGGGNIYKKIRGSQMGWSLHESAPGVPDINGYLAAGWSKQTNRTENRWNDLSQLISLARSSTSGAVTPPTINIAQLETVADIDQWARWWAFCVLINHGETNLSDGVDDDYSIYIRPSDQRAILLAHDMDTTFGAGDTQIPATATIWQAYDATFENEKNFTNPPILRAMFFNNKFVRKFKWHLRNLMDTTFAQTPFDAMTDSVLGAGNWVPETERTRIKTYMTNRRTFVRTQTPADFTAASNLIPNGGFPTTTDPNLTGLSGIMDGARTDRILVNGVPASLNNHDDTWTATGVSAGLSPGINRVLIQALDESGAEFERRTVNIAYNDSNTAAKGPAIAASETWSAAGGPYVIASGLTIAAGATVTIEPGTSVYMGGGSITVAAGGRLLAEGTEVKPVRFTRAPGSSATWTGFVLNGTGAESRLSNLIIEQNTGTAIHGQNGAVLRIDRITFGNPGAQYISLDGCSFEVSNCTFPTATAGFEPVHGTQGIAAGGRGIVRDCVFGRPQGYNDSLDFTGGNRPGPVLHVLNCVFEGSDDDHLDLDSTDAWIEGNVFMHCHRNGASPDSSSGVSGGDDNGAKSEVTVIRNLFYDCDNAVTMKMGNSFALLYNTIARVTKTGGIDTGSGVVNFADDGTTTGIGGRIEGNVIVDAESLARNYTTPGTTTATFVNNILPVAWAGPGSGNVVADPLLNLSLIANPVTATVAQVRAALTLQGNSPAKGRGFGGFDLGAGFPGGIQISGIPVSPTRSTSATLTAGPSGSTGTSAPYIYGYTHYRYALDGGALGAETPVATPLVLTNLPAGSHSVSIIGKDDTGVWQTVPTVSPAWTVAPNAPQILLSEILADNVNAWALGATRPDMIELYNPGAGTVSLAGWGLTDETDVPLKYTFPSGTFIPSGGYLVVAADSLLSQSGELHCGFGLDSGGETVALFAPGSVIGAPPHDTITFGPQIPDLTVGRAGPRLEWTLGSPTRGAVNIAWTDFAPGSGLRINEWLAFNDFIVDGDFIELANAAAKPVALGGLLLTDDALHLAEHHAAGSTNVHPIAPLSYIAANGFVRFLADGDVDKGPDHLSFGLSSFHEHLGLATAQDVLIDNVIMSAANNDVSEGSSPDSSNNITFFALPTPGFSNTTDLTAQSAVLNNLRITEMMFAPSGNAAEYVEFRNIGAAPLNVTGVHFTSGIAFTFPSLTIPAGGYAVITSDLVRFNAQFAGVPAVQWTSGKLANEGENVRIEIAGYELGILDFDYSGTWYPETVGGGASLQIADASRPRATWGQRESWQPGPPSPGAATGFGVIAGPDRFIQMPSSAVLDGAGYPGSFLPGDITYAWTKLSGPGTVNFTAPASMDTNATFSLSGMYELRLQATGPGSVTASDSVVVYAQETFASWAGRVLASQSAANQAAGADPDNDRLTNYAEFALGTLPLTRDANAGVQLVLTGGRLALRYTRNLLAGSTGIVGQISTGLTSWGSSGVEDSLINSSGSVETREARDSLPLGYELRRYLRLQITGQ